MEETKEKSTIIATRIQLNFIGELVAYIILLILSLLLLFVSVSISVCIFFVIGIIGFIELFYIYKNNHSQEIRITYNTDHFTIYDNEARKMRIEKTSIKDLKFNYKKVLFITPYFFSARELNYGKFFIYFLDNGQINKLTLKNIAEPEKVYEKMVHILEWDKIEE